MATGSGAFRSPLLVGDAITAAVLIALAAIPVALAYSAMGACGGAYELLYLGVAALLVSGGIAMLRYVAPAAVAFAFFLALVIAGIATGSGAGCVGL